MIERLLRRAVALEDGEVRPVLWACVYCFFVLASFYVLRPLREEMGIAGGIKNLPQNYRWTLAATIVMVPLFSALVSRFSRRRFIPIAYRFFALNLVGFFLFFQWLPAEQHVVAARVFYVWLSVFNLFVVSVFWGYMADVFTSGQGKRLFGIVAAGGTLGGIAGAGFTSQVVERVGTHAMFLIAALVVEAAVQAFRRLDRQPLALGPVGNLSLDAMAEKVAAVTAKKEERLDRTSWWGGFTLVMRSPYLLLYCLFMLLFTSSSTFAYFEQARFVKAASADPAARTAIFAQIDFWVNVLALAVQLFLTGRLVRWLGLGLALCILPLLSLAGFGSLLAWPLLSTLMVFQILRRGTDYAVSKPTREVLFTVLPREEKYKAKSFIDTFVYRGGDAMSAALYDGLTAGAADPARRVALFSVPVTALWITVSLLLSRKQQRLAAAAAPADQVSPIPRPATAT